MRLARFTVLVVVALLGACGGDDDDEATAATQPPAAETGANGCRPVEAPAPRTPPTLTAPSELLSEAVTYRVAVATSCGEFTIELDQKASPRAVPSFVALARDGYFDDTTFHRIVPGFVIQGGDPGATGAGGPGYQ